MKHGWLLLLIPVLSGCSGLKQLDTEAKLLGGALVTAAVVEASGGTNYGVTHGVVSYGVTHAVETFADQVFPVATDEWAADTVAIIGAAIPAAYYIDKESGNSADSAADYMWPVGNFIYTAYRRLRYEQ